MKVPDFVMKNLFVTDEDFTPHQPTTTFRNVVVKLIVKNICYIGIRTLQQSQPLQGGLTEVRYILKLTVSVYWDRSKIVWGLPTPRHIRLTD